MDAPDCALTIVPSASAAASILKPQVVLEGYNVIAGTGRGRKQTLMQLCHGCAPAWVEGSGSNLVQRDKDESALGQPRMRNLEAGLVHNLIAIKQQIEIERARPIRDSSGTVAAKFALDLKQRIEQFARTKRRFKSDDGIDEARLIAKTHRLRRVKPRARRHAADRAQPANSSGQRSRRRPGRTGQIAAKTDVSGGHDYRLRQRHDSGPCPFLLAFFLGDPITMDALNNAGLGARRNEDIALDLLKFVAGTVGVGRTAVPSTGFSGATAVKPDEQVAQLLELYGRCLKAVEGKPEKEAVR